MFWSLLPFGVVVILVLGMILAASALDNRAGLHDPKGACLVEKTKEHGRYQGKRFAIVDEHTPIRFLSREEFESVKMGNPNFLEMKAGDIVYLTKIPK